jgi:UDP-2,3-diacylglucosamine hydrolase
MAPRLGVLAGAGDLPLRVIEAARALSRPVFVLGFEGIADPAVVETMPHAWVRLGAAGEGMRLLREAGVEELVFAGSMGRPTIASLRPDWRAAKFFARVGMRALGDDGLLRAVIAELEGEGFRVVSVETVLADTLAPAGALGAFTPDAEAEIDIARGLEVARALGALDVGQAVVVQQGIVLGVEAVEGTDALLQRVEHLRREGPRGVLVKLAKPAQDRRMDLPTIGPETVRRAEQAGLAGIAVESGGTLILDRDEMVRLADAAGLFVLGLEPPGSA